MANNVITINGRKLRPQVGSPLEQWELNKKNNTLVPGCDPSYYVDLDRAKTMSEALDWLFHLSRKNWGTPNTLFNLLVVFRALELKNE